MKRIYAFAEIWKEHTSERIIFVSQKKSERIIFWVGEFGLRYEKDICFCRDLKRSHKWKNKFFSGSIWLKIWKRMRNDTCTHFSQQQHNSLREKGSFLIFFFSFLFGASKPVGGKWYFISPPTQPPLSLWKLCTVQSPLPVISSPAFLSAVGLLRRPASLSVRFLLSLRHISTNM